MANQVFSTLDSSKTQWYHYKAVIISGMGFFTDAYDLFCISLVTKLLGPYLLPCRRHPKTWGLATGRGCFHQWRCSVWNASWTALFWFVPIASGLSFSSSPKAVITTLCFFRFWLGFGIGGDYPLSATIMSEYSNKRTRGSFIAAVFAMQGFGILSGGLVGMAVSAIFRATLHAPAYSVDPIGSTPPEADYIWRIILMLGALPAAVTYYWRMKMPETARYTALVAKNSEKARQDMSKVLNIDIPVEKVEQNVQKNNNLSKSFGLFSKAFLQIHGLHLLGTASTWFFVDIAYYSQNLFQKEVFSAVGWLPPAKVHECP
ncbi:putative inorganic phosphate transporter 1-7 [Forsythia ovata]|uniref:Inorganic phosphate transporter 1-7 n=1 Tax=Forsythia ovata TaxID=205694 RepID=A0ABD1U4W2_9LAMI